MAGRCVDGDRAGDVVGLPGASSSPMRIRASRRGKKLMEKVMHTIRQGVPAGLEELAQLGRPYGAGRTTSWRTSTLARRTGRSRRSTSAWSTSAVLLCGLRNLGRSIARSLIHSGGLQGRINAP